MRKRVMQQRTERTSACLESRFLRVSLTLLLIVMLSSGCARDVAEPFESAELDLSRWQLDFDDGCEAEIVDEPVRAGEYSIRFRAEPEVRCEIIPVVWPMYLGKFVREPFRAVRNYNFSIYVPADIVHANKNEILAQWHASPDPFLDTASNRGPALALRMQNGYWFVSRSWDSALTSRARSREGRDIVWRSIVIPGKWTDFEFEVRWSYEDDGFVTMRMDGEPVLHATGPNAFNDLRGVYLKLGIYHPGKPRTLYFDEIEVY